MSSRTKIRIIIVEIIFKGDFSKSDDGLAHIYKVILEEGGYTILCKKFPQFEFQPVGYEQRENEAEV